MITIPGEVVYSSLPSQSSSTPPPAGRAIPSFEDSNPLLPHRRSRLQQPSPPRRYRSSSSAPTFLTPVAFASSKISVFLFSKTGLQGKRARPLKSRFSGIHPCPQENRAENSEGKKQYLILIVQTTLLEPAKLRKIPPLSPNLLRGSSGTCVDFQGVGVDARGMQKHSARRTRSGFGFGNLLD